MLPFTNQDLTFKLNCDDSWRVVCSPARFDENFKQEKMSINACFHPSNTLLQMLVEQLVAPLLQSGTTKPLQRRSMQQLKKHMCSVIFEEGYNENTQSSSEVQIAAATLTCSHLILKVIV